MAFEFPTSPGTGGGGSTNNTPSGSLIFVCNVVEIGNVISNSSSCTSTGSNASSCNTSTSNSGSAVIRWESSVAIDSSLEAVLNNAESCAEAVEAAGNCQAAGAGGMVIYNCKL